MQLAGLVGLSAFKWHGDVGQSARRRFLAEPAHVLMITPESLEVMLISPKIDTAAPVRRPALRGHRRGAQLRRRRPGRAPDGRAGAAGSAIRRIDVQRIGLSATVGDPEVIGRWMQGSSQPTICRH